MRIAFLPIDNRPVCYTLPKIIAGIDTDIEFLIPERNLLGDLKNIADIDALFSWLQNLFDIDAIVLSLDTLIYGGLIPSRRSKDTLQVLQSRVQKLKEILKSKHAKVYAFSSIMRISNNNVNQEEKEYWSQYGKKIFEYSFKTHKFGKCKTDIPSEILDDYIQTRKRNFEINKIFLSLQNDGLFDTLIFSKDDCSEFGFNVMEAQELEKLGAKTKTGADEIPLSLLSRSTQQQIKVCPIFLEPKEKHLISNYEDVSIEKSVLGQLDIANCLVTDENDADILLLINNFKDKQGEIVMRVETEPNTKDFILPDKPYMIADVRYANGSDNAFMHNLLNKNFYNENFYGYSAWNTSANTLGSLICGAKMLYRAKKNNTFDEKYYKHLQMTRFLDDWAYQANVRQNLDDTDLVELQIQMKSYEKILVKIFDIEYNMQYSFPWERLFEVEVEFN